MRMKNLIIGLSLLMIPSIMNGQEKVKQAAGRQQLGEFAPKFAELNDDNQYNALAR